MAVAERRSFSVSSSLMMPSKPTPLLSGYVARAVASLQMPSTGWVQALMRSIFALTHPVHRCQRCQRRVKNADGQQHDVRVTHRFNRGAQWRLSDSAGSQYQGSPRSLQHLRRGQVRFDADGIAGYDQRLNVFLHGGDRFTFGFRA